MKLMRVLVVEDDKRTAVFVSKALKEEGLVVDVKSASPPNLSC